MGGEKISLAKARHIWYGLLVAESVIVTVPDLSPADLQRLISLRRQLRVIQMQIREIAGEAALYKRQPVQCLRCGYDWFPYNQYLPPLCCARCGTTAWNEPPTATSRKPSDPPAPSWRTRTGTGRKPKYRVVVPRMPEEPTVTIIPRVVMPALRAPWEAPVLPPPPAIKPTIQRPPIPQYLGPPWPWEESEPQPERVASHEPVAVEVGTEVMPSATESNEDNIRGTSAEAGDHTEPASVTSVEVPLTLVVTQPPVEYVPPEDVGIPRTDAEREELEKARAEVWPTTRPE